MSLTTFPSRCSDRTGARWRASAGMFPTKQGSRHLVFRGRMFSACHHAYRSDQKGVIKIQMTKTVKENDWSYYVKCCETAASSTAAFNEHVPPENKMLKISFVVPCVAVVEKVSFPRLATKLYTGLKRKPEKNEFVLIEELVPGHFQRFIPNNHKVLGSDLAYLEAFSHFTYWKSNEEFIVCDLKGVREGTEFKFTCPTIHSKDKTFGPDDMGNDGIQAFFSRHVCGKICQPWANNVHENPSAPPYPIRLPDLIEQSVASAVPSSRPTESSNSSVGMPVSGLFNDEVACPGEPTISETTLNNFRLNVPIPSSSRRRRTMSDQTGLPPPYSSVVAESWRPRSNSCLTNLKTDSDLTRHSSAPLEIMNFGRSNQIDSLPTYDETVAALVAAAGANSSRDSRESLESDTGHHGDRLCQFGDSHSGIVSETHAVSSVQTQRTTSQVGTMPPCGSLVPPRGHQLSRSTSRRLVSDSDVETGYQWYMIPYTHCASMNNSADRAPVDWNGAGGSPMGDLVGQLVQIPLGADSAFAATQLPSRRRPSHAFPSGIEMHPMLIPSINVEYSS